MIETKFEELYAQYKGFQKYEEEFNKNLEERRQTAVKKAETATEEEIFEMLLELNSMPQKVSHDISIITDRLLTIYMLLPESYEVSSEVKESIKDLKRFDTYYAFIDGELKTINEKLHEAYDSNYKILAEQYINQRE